MQRVLVIGSPGSGKSTFAAELAGRTGLPLIYLDQKYWRRGWVEPDKGSWATDVEKLAAGRQWIIDGNYSGTLGLRLARADTVIDLQLPAWLCVWRILRRVAGSSGRSRPEMAEGCPEQFNLDFLLYTAAFPRRARKRIEAKLINFTGTCIELRSSADVRRFLASFSDGG